MAHQFEKNYYAILGVREDATSDELRKAYRDLAKKFHPDAAPDNPFAETHFAAIGAAYEVLSNPALRAAYDEERWLRGFTTRSRKAQRITPQWIRTEARKLREHMAHIDTYRMNHSALRDYVVELLSDEHLSVLQGEHVINALIFRDVFQSVQRLRSNYAPQIVERLKRLVPDESELHLQIESWLHARAREEQWSKYRPLIILGATALLCLLLWWLSRH